MRLFDPLLLCISLLLVCGCKTGMHSARQQFLSATATNPHDYLHLYEVSPEIMRDREAEVFRATKIAVKGVRSALEQCANPCLVLQDRLKRIEHAAAVIQSNRLAMVERLEAVYNPKTDTALFFHLQQKDGREELGWAVMSGKTLKSRLVLDGGDAEEE